MKKLFIIFLLSSFGWSQSNLGDLNCDSLVNVTDAIILQDLMFSQADPDSLALLYPCFNNNITGLTYSQMEEMIEMMDEQTEINVVNYNENNWLGYWRSTY